MGFEVIRFVNSNEINQDLICIICKGVLEDPVWAQHCEHAFCKVCINKWLIRKTTCPNDRQNLQQSHLKPIPRFMRNVLAKLEIRCDFVSLGCQDVIKLETFRQHISVCDFNPEKPIECQRGCGLIIKKADINEHNCVKELRKTANGLIEENLKYERIMNAFKYDMNSLRNENHKLYELTSNLQNDIKLIKLFVGFKNPLINDSTSVSCITGAQTTSPSLTSMATSTSIKTSERNCRLVPNPCVLITPLQMSSLRNDTVLSTSDEPSSSTLPTPSSGRLVGEEPAFKRRATTIRPISTLRPIHSSVQIIRSYSPPSNYSSPTNSPRFVPNMSTLSPQNESISQESEDSERGTTITIADYSSSYNYITLDAEQEFEDNDENDEETNQIHEDYEFEVDTNEDNV